MKSVYDPSTLAEITQRLNNLSASSQAQWGKMNVSQMLKHCRLSLEVAAGERSAPQTFSQRLKRTIIGPFIRHMAYNEQPIPRHVPTSRAFIIVDTDDFSQERKAFLDKVTAFSEAGEAGCSDRPHPIFGKLSPKIWGISTYKHLDHHLRQFSV